MSLTTISAPRPVQDRRSAAPGTEVRRPPRPGRAALRRPYPGEQDWQETGSCRNADPALFFAPEQESPTGRERRERAAKSICGSCPVLSACRAYALTTLEPYGVWGGLSERERARMLNLRGRFDRRDRADRRSDAARRALEEVLGREYVEAPRREPGRAVELDGDELLRRDVDLDRVVGRTADKAA